MIKCVLFDLDGTLLDDEIFNITSKVIEGRKYGYEINPEDVKKTLGMSKDKSEILFKSIYGEDFPYRELAPKRIEYILDYFKKHGLKYRPYAQEIISFLEENKIKICICTSTSRKYVNEYMKYGDLFDHVDHLITGDMVKNGKPAPDIFLLGAKESGFEVSECLVVEDANTGVEGALAGNFDVIQVPDLAEPLEKFKDCVKIYSSLLDVINYIKKVNNI